jgi:hypothetical protein
MSSNTEWPSRGLRQSLQENAKIISWLDHDTSLQIVSKIFVVPAQLGLHIYKAPIAMNN